MGSSERSSSPVCNEIDRGDDQIELHRSRTVSKAECSWIDGGANVWRTKEGATEGKAGEELDCGGLSGIRDGPRDGTVPEMRGF